MPGAEFLQHLEEPTTDVSGTAPKLPNFANFQSPEPNMPESDLGGELTPQSYDIRANSVNVPEPESPQEEDPGLLQRFGRALADYFSPTKRAEMSQQNQQLFNRYQQQPVEQAPPIETAQVDIQEGLPPVAPKTGWTPAPEPSPGILGALSDYINPTKRDQMGEYTKDLMTQSQLKAQGKDPNEVFAQKHEQLAQDVEKAMENPMQVGAYGAAEEVANSPALKAAFETYTGINYDDEVAAQVSQHELAMKGIEDSLNGINTDLDEQAEGIKQRILNNQATDADKFYIGLALLMPLLIGGFFGKEAGLGALAGASKGFADVLGGRQKGIREDESSLLDINKQKAINQEKLANIGLEKAKLEPTIRKNLPSSPNEHLVGMERIVYTDPATGKQTEAFELLPGFVAKSQYVNNEKARERMEKAASELSETKTYVQQVNDLTENVMEILGQLKDKPFWKKAHIGPLNALVPGSLSGLTDKVKWKGQMVPAGPLLESELGILANQYAHAQDLGQLDRAAQAHMDKLIGNPTKTLLSPQDVENQVMNVRSFVQNELINKTKNKGFLPEFVINSMNEANVPLHGKLNQRQQDKRTSEIEKKLAQEEMSYAK
jgi:hypothetical protein